MIDNIPRPVIEHLIDDWILKERDRQILKRRLLDGHRRDDGGSGSGHAESV